MGYLAFVQTVKSTANQNLTTLGGLDWRHWNGFSQNSSTRKTSGAGISDLSAIGSIATDQTTSARTVTASDPTLSSANSGVFFGANGTTGWGERFTVDIGTTRKKCYIMAGQFSSAVKIDISLSDSSASAISYTYAASSIYSTDGLLIEFDLEANSAGQTATVDITCSTNIDFGRIGVQAITLANASAGPTIFDLTKATFSTSAKTTQNRLTATPTAPTLSWSAKAAQYRLTAALTAAALSWSAKTIQNRLTASLGAAVLNWSAKTIEFVQTGVPVILDLTAAVLSWSAKTVQNRLTAGLTAAQVSWSAKAVQNRLTATLTAAQIRLTAQVISARLAVTLTAATMTSWSAKAVQNRLTVALTRATLNLQSLAIDFVSDAIVGVARRFRSRYSRYRKLLKQRRF